LLFFSVRFFCKTRFFAEEIEIVGVKASALKGLVDFCYTGKITINNTNVKSILPAACMLQMNEVQHVVGTEQFYQLTANQLIELISSDQLNIRSEEKVFEAVLQWVRFDPSVREQFLPQLLEHVRLPLCSPKFLAETVSEDALVKADEACRDLLDEAKVITYQRLQLSTPVRANIQGPRIQLRDVMIRTGVFYRVRRRDEETLWYLERLDPQEAIPLWQQVAPLSRERYSIF
ncbi:BTB And Kelch, partial [Cooperia oncophora]